eukprot:6247456-Prymnesium_polylepis.1
MGHLHKLVAPDVEALAPQLHRTPRHPQEDDPVVLQHLRRRGGATGSRVRVGRRAAPAAERRRKAHGEQAQATVQAARGLLGGPYGRRRALLPSGASAASYRG